MVLVVHVWRYFLCGIRTTCVWFWKLASKGRLHKLQMPPRKGKSCLMTPGLSKNIQCHVWWSINSFHEYKQYTTLKLFLLVTRQDKVWWKAIPLLADTDIDIFLWGEVMNMALLGYLMEFSIDFHWCMITWKHGNFCSHRIFHKSVPIESVGLFPLFYDYLLTLIYPVSGCVITTLCRSLWPGG